MRDQIQYVHLFGPHMHALLIWGGDHPYRDKLTKTMESAKAKHMGGVTFRIDHERQTIVAALCSLKDPYSRRRGRAITEYRARILDPAPFSVVIPSVGHHRNLPFCLQQFAVAQSLALWQKFGWPVDQFCINFCMGDAGEEEA